MIKTKRKKVMLICSAIITVIIVAALLITKVFIPKQKYDKAMSLIESGVYNEAYIILKDLNYKDSSNKIEEVKALILSNAEVGSHIYFGNYEQDNINDNGKEAIEWIVLGKENGRLLVISRYALDCQPYNSTLATWETCTLRPWLNAPFFNKAFNSDEQAMIQKATVTADRNPKYEKSPGKDTEDKVFLLSITEAKEYFNFDSDRQCTATAYAKVQGIYLNPDDESCLWWLRSPGSGSIRIANVHDDGSINLTGSNCSNNDIAVRPAMWISVE